MSPGNTPAPATNSRKLLLGLLLAIGSLLAWVGWPKPGKALGPMPPKEPANGAPGLPSAPPDDGSRDRKWLDALLLVLGLAGALFCGSQAYVADTPTTPGGMLALEFPGPRSGVLAALALLDSAPSLEPPGIGRTEVRSALYWDFAFIACYAATGCFAMFLVVQRRFARETSPESKESGASWLVAQAAIVAPIVAGAFDIIENVALLSILDKSVCGPSCVNGGLLGSITTLGALFKWTLAVFATAYLIYSLSFVFWRWVHPARHDTDQQGDVAS